MWGLVDPEDVPRGDLVRPRSYCPKCRTQISAAALTPILGFVFLRGKCAACGAPISPRYPLVEFAAMGVGAASILVFGVSVEAVLAAVFGWMLLALGVTDWETGFLPDWLTLPLMIVGLGANAFSLFAPPLDAVIGAAAGGFVFWAIGAGWRAWRGIDALGLGDAKLLAALGAWTGWPALPLIVLIGSVGSLLGVFLARGFGRTIGGSDAIPFGPGLCLAGLVVLFAGWTSL